MRTPFTSILCSRLTLIFAFTFAATPWPTAHTDTYTYDSANRLVSVTYDSGKRIQFDYDINGNIKTRTITDGNAGDGVDPNSLTDAWAEFAYTGTELGTFSQPFDTTNEGVVALVPDGTGTLHIKAGSTTETVTIVKPMTIVAEGGNVQIGI